MAGLELAWPGSVLQTAMKIQPFRHTDRYTVMDAIGSSGGEAHCLSKQRNSILITILIIIIIPIWSLAAFKTSVGE